MDKSLRLAGPITCLMLGACFGDVSDPMVVSESQLEILEENQAAWPALNEDGTYPEAMDVVIGDEDAEPGWVHARAYIHAPLKTVWDAMREADVVVNRAAVETWYLDGECPPQGFAYCLEFYSSMSKFGVDFDTITTWMHELRTGSDDAPEEVVMLYQKTWGTEMVSLNTGSVELTAVSQDVTALSYIGWLETWGGDDSGAIAEYADSLYVDVIAYVHGEPLPQFDD